MNGLALKELARSLALVMHEGQCRKGTGEPYFNHVERVAEGVQGWEAKTVAYLHDLVEDTNMTMKMIEMLFPLRICDAVWRLTRQEETYAEFIDRVLIPGKSSDFSGRDLALEVKISDVRDNLRDIQDIPGGGASMEKKYGKALSALLEAQDAS